jgi:putative addiction module antidote
MSVLKLMTVGDSVGVILPEEILARLRVRAGDTLYVIETRRGIELTPHDPELTAQTDAAERAMREDQDALGRLAE